jgi:hypothetical protein
MTKQEIAEATLMALRPVGAEYLGVEPYEQGWRAICRELDGTERRGVGPEPVMALRALILWYAVDQEYAVVYGDDGEVYDL